MLDPIIESPILLTAICGLLVILVVALGYMSPYLHRPAVSAKFPMRSFTRNAVIAFVVLVNAASLGLAHRLPVGSTLIAVGFLMLLFLPAEDSADRSPTSR